MSRFRTTGPLPAAIAVLALTMSACGSQDDTAPADDSDTSSTSQAADTPVALTADASSAGKCAVPSAATLSTFDTAFAGTVTSVEEGIATLSVQEWYVGDQAATVTVDTPSGDLQDLLMAVDFEEGSSYLVSATGGRVTLCGFTAEESPELRTIYDEAFGG